MRIPVSPGQQVQQAPMSSYMARNTVVRAPSVAGALGDAAGQVSEVQHFADNLRTEDVFNQTLAEAQKIKLEASQQLGANVQPKDGKSFQDVYLQKFDDLIPKMEGGLSNSRQKTILQRKVATLRQSLAGDLDAHAAKETKAYYVGINNNTTTLEAENAKANLENLAELTRGQMRVNGAVADNAKLLGWSPEQTQVERQKAMDAFHGGVIGAAIDAGKLGYAKTYLENHANDMSADLKAKVVEVVKKKEGDLTADATAETIFKQFGPKNDKDAVNLDKMNAAIPEGLTPETKKAIRTGLADMARTHDYSVKQREDATVSAFVQAIEGGKPWNSIKSDPMFSDLRGDKQYSLRKMFEEKYGITRGAKDSSLYNDLLMNPMVLEKMSEDAIIALTPMIGKAYRDDLLSVKKRLSGKPATQGVVNDAVNYYGQKQGYLVSKKDKLVPKDPAEWAEIQYKINQRIASDKAESESDISNAVRSVMAKTAIKTKGRLWGTNTESRRVSSMSDTELDAAVVTISPADLETVYSALARRGIYHPTKRQIVEANAALQVEE